MSSNRATLSSVTRTFKSAKTWLTSGVGQMCSVERSRNGLFISSIGASLLCAPMNAAAIVSVHGGVIAWQQSRTMEQRTELHGGSIGLCLGACAQHRAIDQCPWVKAKLSDSS